MHEKINDVSRLGIEQKKKIISDVAREILIEQHFNFTCLDKKFRIIICPKDCQQGKPMEAIKPVIDMSRNKDGDLNVVNIYIWQDFLDDNQESIIRVGLARAIYKEVMRI